MVGASGEAWPLSPGERCTCPPGTPRQAAKTPFPRHGWLQRNAVGAVGVKLGAASVGPVRGRRWASRRRLGGNVYLPRDRALSVTPGERYVPLSATPQHIFTSAAPETGRARGETRRAGVDADRSRNLHHEQMRILRAMRSGLTPRNPGRKDT